MVSTDPARISNTPWQWYVGVRRVRPTSIRTSNPNLRIWVGINAGIWVIDWASAFIQITLVPDLDVNILFRIVKLFLFLTNSPWSHVFYSLIHPKRDSNNFFAISNGNWSFCIGGCRANDHEVNNERPCRLITRTVSFDGVWSPTLCTRESNQHHPFVWRTFHHWVTALMSPVQNLWIQLMKTYSNSSVWARDFIIFYHKLNALAPVST